MAALAAPAATLVLGRAAAAAEAAQVEFGVVATGVSSALSARRSQVATAAMPPAGGGRRLFRWRRFGGCGRDRRGRFNLMRWIDQRWHGRHFRRRRSRRGWPRPGCVFRRGRLHNCLYRLGDGWLFRRWRSTGERDNHDWSFQHADAAFGRDHQRPRARRGHAAAGWGDRTARVDVSRLGFGGGQFWSFSKFAKIDAGTWTLIGTNNGYTTPTEVKEGTLVVDGSFYGSPITVDDGATLQGIGTTGAVTIESGGVHAPGNSIGTQTVIDNYSSRPARFCRSRVNDAGSSDRVVVVGGVGQSDRRRSCKCSPHRADYTAGMQYLIIDNQGDCAGHWRFRPKSSATSPS